MKSPVLRIFIVIAAATACCTWANAQTPPAGSRSLMPLPQADYRYPSTNRSLLANPAGGPQFGAPQANTPYYGAGYYGGNAAANSLYPNQAGYYPPGNGAAMPVARPMPVPTNSPVAQPAWRAYPAGNAAYGSPRPAAPGYAPYGAPNSAVYANQPMPQAEPLPGPAGSYQAAPYDPYMNAMGGPWGDDCDWCDSLFRRLGSRRWYAGGRGLIMTRDTANAEWFSYFDSNEAIQLLDSRHRRWGGGFEVMIGRRLYDDCNYCGGYGGACNQCGGGGSASGSPWATELSYFGVFPGVTEANLFDPAGAVSLNSTLNINTSVQYNAGTGNQPIVGWFDASQRHRLRREYEIHNVEWNLLHDGCDVLGGYGPGKVGYGGRGYGACGPVCGPRLSCSWLVGLRYFRFTDRFRFDSDDLDTTLTGAPNEVYYAVRTENNLLGFQFGGSADYRRWNRFRFHARTKAGLYANYIQHNSFLGGSVSPAFITAGPNTGLAWIISSTSTDVAMLGELDLGLTYQLSRRWEAVVGYRGIAVAGVALSTNQIPRDFRGIQDVEAIDTNGSLILHGGYAGFVYRR